MRYLNVICREFFATVVGSPDQRDGLELEPPNAGNPAPRF